MEEPGITFSRTSKRSLYIFIIIAAIVGVLCFVIGILIGRFAACDESDDSSPYSELDKFVRDADPKIADLIMNAIDNGNIENNLRRLTEKPHVAGQPAERDLGKYIKDTLIEYGVDSVKAAPYEVLLSYPGNQGPDGVQLLSNANDTIFDSVTEQSNITYEEGVVPPFNAYSPAKEIMGDLMYVNYGRVEDYDYLANRSINVTGKIVIARYGKIFRGSKVAIAARHGALGVILYSDPKDYTWPQEDSRVYPDTIWLPPTAAQRGTIFTRSGDPLTPGYPAISTAYRYPEESKEASLPTIPALPIGYGAAVHFLQALGGEEVPEDWRGGLNITYRVGPLSSRQQVRLNVTTSNSRRLVRNVIGIIKGQVEPDRYVILGNHRDAWVYGAIDPSSGTAVMLEVARVMAQLVKNGRWRPRRSIMFCSWGAEEYGLIGSTEWAEQYVKSLGSRAVAYLNLDPALTGNSSFGAQGSGLIMRTIFEAAKKVPNPNPKEVEAGRLSVYDTWKESYPMPGYDMPMVSSLGSGSDYAPMLQIVGITSVDFRYTYNRTKYQIGLYPLYHTEYETFYLVKSLMDHEFKYHQAVGRVAGEMLRSLADSLFIPFNVSDYAWKLELARLQLHSDYGPLLSTNLHNYTMLQKVIKEFGQEVNRFETSLTSINRKDPMAIRMVNDQLLQLERAFLDPEGLPSRPLKKHLLFAENSNDAYAGSSFPGLVDLLFKIEDLPPAEQKKRWEQVRRHFSVLLNAIQSAGYTLRDVISFVEEQY